VKVDVVGRAVEHSAAPAEVGASLERLEEADPGLRDVLVADEALLHALIAVLGASRFLTRLLLAEPAATEVLSNLDRRVPRDAADVSALRRWKSLELLRVAARDLTGRDQLESVGAGLALLADDVLDASYGLAGADGLAVIGMGKLGGRELNYASDVDVMFVGEGDARPLMEVARSCFRVDVDLRPEGRDGPLVRSLDSYTAYWDRWARTWEFQALLKARPVAGDADLGRAFMEQAGERLWTRRFAAEELREVRALKARAEQEIARRGLSDREVKRGWGGIRDAEFAVQLLQLVHGRQDAALRSPTTLTVLAELAAAGYVAGDDATALAAAYRFLRAVEHRLQLVEDQQVHALPADAAGRSRLARVMGYRDLPQATALARFEADLRHHQASVRSIHERLFFRPLLEAFTGGGTPLAPDAAAARLAAFGFADAERTRRAVHELTSGLNRASRLMQQMLPLLLGWLSESPDPDLGLLGLRTLATASHSAAQLLTAFRESPEAARRLCLLLGTGPRFATAFERQPEMVADLADVADEGALARRRPAELVEQALSWRGDRETRRRGLLRLKDAEELRVATRDVLDLDDVDATAGALTDLAEAVLGAALETLGPAVRMAVVAMGRFGGAELSYASDLDVLLVYEGGTNADVAAAEGVAEELLRFVKGTTPATRLYLLDADLRPEGKQGPLSRSLGGYRAYYDRYARTWERQALVRARPVAGDHEVGDRFMELVDDFVWSRPFTEDDEREVRRMKARIERERIPSGEDPQFHLKLGRGSLSDVEWTAQLLQLRHGIRAPGTVAALRALTGAGHLLQDDAAALLKAYRFCEQARNRWFVVHGAPGDALPTQADQLATLARSLDMTAADLREHYRRVTRRARAVMERLFYGRE
jgi:glutamate-ammonia-ligase adenylyltransferase